MNLEPLESKYEQRPKAPSPGGPTEVSDSEKNEPKAQINPEKDESIEGSAFKESQRSLLGNMVNEKDAATEKNLRPLEPDLRDQQTVSPWDKPASQGLEEAQSHAPGDGPLAAHQQECLNAIGLAGVKERESRGEGTRDPMCLEEAGDPQNQRLAEEKKKNELNGQSGMVEEKAPKKGENDSKKEGKEKSKEKNHKKKEEGAPETKGDPEEGEGKMKKKKKKRKKDKHENDQEGTELKKRKKRVKDDKDMESLDPHKKKHRKKRTEEKEERERHHHKQKHHKHKQRKEKSEKEAGDQNQEDRNQNDKPDINKEDNPKVEMRVFLSLENSKEESSSQAIGKMKTIEGTSVQEGNSLGSSGNSGENQEMDIEKRGDETQIDTNEPQGKQKKPKKTQSTRCNVCQKTKSLVACTTCRRSLHAKCAGFNKRSEMPKKFKCPHCK